MLEGTTSELAVLKLFHAEVIEGWLPDPHGYGSSRPQFAVALYLLQENLLQTSDRSTPRRQPSSLARETDRWRHRQ